MLAAARELAASSSITPLAGRGSELEREFAHGLVRQLFEQPLVEVEPRVRERLLSGAAGHAAGALGFSPHADAPPDGFTVLHGLYWLCAGLSDRAPLLLSVDDAHWGDAPSLRFLAYLAPRIAELPVALIVAARRREPGAGASILSELVADPLVRLTRPRQLSREVVAELVRERLAPDTANEFVAAFHAATLGNPFLVEELLGSCVEEGVHPSAAAAARLRELVPGAVTHAILLRLGRLPEAAAELARAVAVLGPGADLRRAAAVADLEDTAAAAAADALAGADILGEERPLAFAHPLVRSAVYRDMPPAERALRHARAADLLRREGAPPDRVAVHLLAVEPAADPTVVATLRAAARGTIAQGAPDVAAGYLRRALAEPPEPKVRSTVLLETGTAEARAGDDLAHEHLEQALECAEDRTERVHVSLILGRTLLLSERQVLGIETFDRAAATVAAGDPDLELLFEGAAVAVANLDSSLAPRFAERFERLRHTVQQRGSAPPNVLAVLAMHLAMSGGPLDEAVAFAERALTREGPLAEEAAQAPFFTHACAGLLFAERYHRVRGLYEHWLAEARELGLPQQFSTASCFLALISHRLGEVPSAEAHARAAIEAERQHSQPLFRPLELAVLLYPLIERGELDAAERELSRPDFTIEDHHTIHFAYYLHARGSLRLAQGRHREALEDLLASGERLHALQARNPALVAWRSDAALAYLGLGEQRDAARLAADELELARALGAPRALGVSLRVAGVVQRGEGGVELLRQAVAVLEGTPATLEHSRALTDLGSALRRAGQRSSARRVLESAMDSASRCGATALAERARAELRILGAKPRRLVVSGIDSLTASERRVADMAAEGHTNREIAQALFVTSRTVETHLTHVYRKLSIQRREQLAEALARAASSR